MLAGGLFIGSTAPIAFYILRLGTPIAAFLGQAIFVVGLTLHSGSLGLFLTEHFTTCPHLYTAIAVSYNVAMAIFGGIASVVSTAFANELGGYGAAVWLSAIACISCPALHFGYHPTRGIIPRSRMARLQQQVADKAASVGDVELAAAKGGEGKVAST